MSKLSSRNCESQAVKGAVDDVDGFIKECVHTMPSLYSVLLGNHLELTGQHNGGVNVRNLGICKVHIVVVVTAAPFLVVSPRNYRVSCLELASPAAIEVFSQNSFGTLAL